MAYQSRAVAVAVAVAVAAPRVHSNRYSSLWTLPHHDHDDDKDHDRVSQY